MKILITIDMENDTIFYLTPAQKKALNLRRLKECGEGPRVLYEADCRFYYDHKAGKIRKTSNEIAGYTYIYGFYRDTLFFIRNCPKAAAESFGELLEKADLSDLLKKVSPLETALFRHQDFLRRGREKRELQKIEDEQRKQAEREREEQEIRATGQSFLGGGTVSSGTFEKLLRRYGIWSSLSAALKGHINRGLCDVSTKRFTYRRGQQRGAKGIFQAAFMLAVAIQRAG